MPRSCLHAKSSALPTSLNPSALPTCSYVQPRLWRRVGLPQGGQQMAVCKACCLKQQSGTNAATEAYMHDGLR